MVFYIISADPLGSERVRTIVVYEECCPWGTPHPSSQFYCARTPSPRSLLRRPLSGNLHCRAGRKGWSRPGGKPPAHHTAPQWRISTASPGGKIRWKPGLAMPLSGKTPLQAGRKGRAERPGGKAGRKGWAPPARIFFVFSSGKNEEHFEGSHN